MPFVDPDVTSSGRFAVEIEALTRIATLRRTPSNLKPITKQSRILRKYYECIKTANS